MKRAKARGTVSPDGRTKKIAIHFERKTFDEIAAEAAAQGVTFNELVRAYIARCRNPEGRSRHA